MKIDVDSMKGSIEEGFSSALSLLSEQNTFFETFVVYLMCDCCLEGKLCCISGSDCFSAANDSE